MKNILMINNDERFSETVGRMLFYQGHTVTNASTAKEAYDMMKEGEYDLILSDVMAPYASGYELLVHLKEKDNNRKKKVPLVVVSGIADEKNVVECLKLGVDDYVRRPISVPEFLLRIQRFLDITPY